MKQWHPTNHFPTNMEPYELLDERLESFFDDAEPKKLQYLGPEGSSDPNDPPETRLPHEYCVRVNVRIRPIDTKIGIPNEMMKWVKATLTQRGNSHIWELIENREACYLITEFAEEDDVRRSLSFLQPPRKIEDVEDAEDAVCFVATLREVDSNLEFQEDSLDILTKRQRCEVKAKAEEMQGADTANNLILKEEGRVRMSHENLTKKGRV